MKTLAFPLYHSTSSIFEESIKTHGLGGEYPFSRLLAIELLQLLEFKANKYLSDKNEWHLIKVPVGLIAKQKTGFLNWNHSDLYLTPSLYTAFGYSRNEYGSELLSYIFKVIKLLRSYDVSIEEIITAKFASIFSFEDVENKSIIFQIDDLPIVYLSSGEKNENLLTQIDVVNYAIEKFGIEGYQKHVTQTNFKLARAIPHSLLKNAEQAHIKKS